MQVRAHWPTPYKALAGSADTHEMAGRMGGLGWLELPSPSMSNLQHRAMPHPLSRNPTSPGRVTGSCDQMSANQRPKECSAQPDGSCPISEESWNVLDGLGSLKDVKYASSGLPPTHSL